MTKARSFIEEVDSIKEQLGQGGEPAGTGGTDECCCSNPDCSMYETPVPHDRGVPCNEMTCEECGKPLTGIGTVGSKVK